MPAVRPRHEKRVTSRGKVYYYHQITGERLPDDRETRARRLMEINTSLDRGRGQGAAQGIKAGSFADVIARYKRSTDYTALADKTRREYSRHLEAIRQKWGDLPVSGLRRKHVLQWRDKLAQTPREANYRLMVLRRLMAFAIEREVRNDDPTYAVRKLKEGRGYQAWPHELYQAVLDDPQTPKALADALRLLRWTGQRPQDVVAMTWAHVDRQGGYIAVTQQKTGARVWIPLHPQLVEVLDAIPRTAAVIATMPDGRPWTVNLLAKHTRWAITRQGQQGQCYTPHGLRHSAGDALAEAGCTNHEIAAILGHKSLSMVQRYTATADKKRLASAAVKRLDADRR